MTFLCLVISISSSVGGGRGKGDLSDSGGGLELVTS